MKVKATGIEADLGNNGIILYIADNGGKHVGKAADRSGDCRVV